MPKLEAGHAARTLIHGVLKSVDVARLGVRLELSLVQFVTVVEEELIGGFEAGFRTVLDDVARTRRARQVLNLQ